MRKKNYRNKSIARMFHLKNHLSIFPSSINFLFNFLIFIPRLNDGRTVTMSNSVCSRGFQCIPSRGYRLSRPSFAFAPSYFSSRRGTFSLSSPVPALNRRFFTFSRGRVSLARSFLHARENQGPLPSGQHQRVLESSVNTGRSRRERVRDTHKAFYERDSRE